MESRNLIEFDAERARSLAWLAAQAAPFTPDYAGEW